MASRNSEWDTSQPFRFSMTTGILYFAAAASAGYLLGGWPTMPFISPYTPYWIGFVVGSLLLGATAGYAYSQHGTIAPAIVVLGGFTVAVGYTVFQHLTMANPLGVGFELLIYLFYLWPVVLGVAVLAGVIARFVRSSRSSPTAN